MGTLVDAVMLALNRASDSTMPRINPKQGSRQNYWWTNEMAELKRAGSADMRKRAMGTRNRPEAAAG